MTCNSKTANKMYRAYKTAVAEGRSKDEVITFEGEQLLLGYAKYLLLHLGNMFPLAGIKEDELYKLK